MSTRTRSRSKSPGDRSVNDGDLNKQTINKAKSPKNQSKKVEWIKQESENVYQLERNETDNSISAKSNYSNELQNVEYKIETEKLNDSSEQKEEGTLKNKSEIVPEVEETETNADKIVNKRKGKRPSISKKEEHENQGTETPTRVMRSQVKTVKSPEVIRREESLEQIRLTRARKRSKSGESESDNEEPIQKKLNRSRSRIDSDSESEDTQVDTESRSGTITMAKARKNSGNNKIVDVSTELKDIGSMKGKYLFVMLKNDRYEWNLEN